VAQSQSLHETRSSSSSAFKYGYEDGVHQMSSGGQVVVIW